jgi:hypothetical protein
MAVGVTSYEFLAGAVVPYLSPEQSAKVCPILEKAKKFWNLSITAATIYLENKDAKQGELVTVNLNSFNAVLNELFAEGIIKEDYKIYFDATIAAVRFLVGSLLPNVKIVEASTVDLSGLYISFECDSRAVMNKDLAVQKVSTALAKIDMADAPAAIQALKAKLGK